MTINIDQARELHELGVRKFADIYYHQLYSGEWSLNEDPSHVLVINSLPAYNAEELISMIKGHFDVIINKDKSVEINTWCDKFKGYDYFKANTLTEALANKLIYDIENRIVSIEEVNK